MVARSQTASNSFNWERRREEEVGERRGEKRRERRERENSKERREERDS